MALLCAINRILYDTSVCIFILLDIIVIEYAVVLKFYFLISFLFFFVIGRRFIASLLEANCLVSWVVTSATARQEVSCSIPGSSKVFTELLSIRNSESMRKTWRYPGALQNTDSVKEISSISQQFAQGNLKRNASFVFISGTLLEWIIWTGEVPLSHRIPAK